MLAAIAINKTTPNPNASNCLKPNLFIIPAFPHAGLFALYWPPQQYSNLHQLKKCIARQSSIEEYRHRTPLS
jgi:hypothetical protein